MNAPYGKPANGIWPSLKRTCAIAALSLISSVGKMLSRLGPVGQDMRAWAAIKLMAVRGVS